MKTVSIIITALNEAYIHKTIDDILKHSDESLLEIIVIDDCSDEEIIIDNPIVKVLRQDARIGLIRGRNLASDVAMGDIIISIDPHVKVSSGWLKPIIKKINDNYKCVAVPATRGLDPIKWVSTGRTVYKTGWDWKLNFYWREDNTNDLTPCFAGHCFAFSKLWWQEIGGFDVGMDKWGCENIEFSLKTWLAGGSVEIIREVVVSHWFKDGFTYDMDNKTLLKNKARLVEVWFDDYRHNFYKAISRRIPDIGDISECVKIRNNIQKKPLEWFLRTLQPELLNVNKLQNIHADSRICILGAGSSLDHIPESILKSYDVVIGVNYVSLIYKCDYVVFHDLKPAETVLKSGKYKPEQLLVPFRLKNGNGRGVVDATDLSNDWLIYNLDRQSSDKALKKKGPPFFWHATTAHTAVHIAVFMGAKSITMIACDCCHSPTGKSHTKLVPQYRNGNYWKSSESVNNYLVRSKQGYETLGVALKRWNIPLLRYGY